MPGQVVSAPSILRQKSREELVRAIQVAYETYANDLRIVMSFFDMPDLDAWRASKARRAEIVSTFVERFGEQVGLIPPAPVNAKDILDRQAQERRLREARAVVRTRTPPVDRSKPKPGPQKVVDTWAPNPNPPPELPWLTVGEVRSRLLATFRAEPNRGFSIHEVRERLRGRITDEVWEQARDRMLAASEMQMYGNGNARRYQLHRVEREAIVNRSIEGGASS